MKPLLILICLLEVAAGIAANASDSGLKPEYHVGQPGWRRMRENAKRRERIEAAAAREERAQIAADHAHGVEDLGGGMKVSRYTFDYAYPVQFHALSVIDGAKKELDKKPFTGRTQLALAAITYDGKDQFSYLVSRVGAGKFEVEAETLEAAALAGLPYNPDDEELTDGVRSGKKIKTLSYQASSLTREAIFLYVDAAKRLMLENKLKSLAAIIKVNVSNSPLSFLLVKRAGGKIVATADNEYTRLQTGLPLVTPSSGCDEENLK